MSLFSRGSRREEAVKDFYELCFEDFQRRTHNTIIELAEENQKLKEQVQDLKADYGTIAQIERDLYKSIIEEVREYCDLSLIMSNDYIERQFANNVLEILDKAKGQ